MKAHHRHDLLARADRLRAVKIVQGSLSSLLSDISFAFTASSTTALEIALAGVPIVVVGRESDLDLDALAWFPEFAPPTRDPRELKARVERILSSGVSARADARAWAVGARRRCLSPLGDAQVHAFVNPIPVMRQAGRTPLQPL